MAIRIKQGDAYSIPVKVKLGNELINIADVNEVEFMLGGHRMVYPADVTYDATTNEFLLPITQSMSFGWEKNSTINLDVRVKFTGGDVRGIQKIVAVGIVDAISEEVL